MAVADLVFFSAGFVFLTELTTVLRFILKSPGSCGGFIVPTRF